MEATDPKLQSSPVAENPEVSTEVLATLAEIGEEVNASLDLDEVLAHAAVLIKRHIDYEMFGVLMVDADGAYLAHRFANETKAVGYGSGQRTRRRPVRQLGGAPIGDDQARAAGQGGDKLGDVQGVARRLPGYPEQAAIRLAAGQERHQLGYRRLRELGEHGAR